MTLKELTYNCADAEFILGNPQDEVCGLQCDSRKVSRGELFVAVSGCGNDGRAYIGKALENGAGAILCEPCGEKSCEGVPSEEQILRLCRDKGAALIYTSNSARALAAASDRWFDHPSGKLKLVGITGTNGKTTTVTLLYNLFRSLGYECGMLSTIANYVGGRCYPTANTTSDPLTINYLLAEMVDCGAEFCFMEVSSIGVDQHRTDFLEFKVGIFSNLTHDHLDYHKTFDNYLRCKQRFFDSLGKDATAITNADDRNGMIMVQNTKAKVVTYSCRNWADHCCKILEESIEGMLLSIDSGQLYSRLIGEHNAYNLLAIYCTALALGADRDQTLVALSALQGAKGRLETIYGPNGLCVVLDYAHTPDALENVLSTLRQVSRTRTLICLFGCGGDRDRSKRPEMGKVAGQYADRVILSSDNSRSERTEDIIADIKTGMDSSALRKTICISDRAEAIRSAILLAPRDSVILLAGKGHEDYQIIGKEKRHFDEREIVAGVFSEINNG